MICLASCAGLVLGAFVDVEAVRVRAGDIGELGAVL
jgi:hypothetical protein